MALKWLERLSSLLRRKNLKTTGNERRVRVKKVDIEKLAKTGGLGAGRPAPSRAGGRTRPARWPGPRGAEQIEGQEVVVEQIEGELQHKGVVKKEVTQEDIKKEIRDTLARLSGGKKSKSSKMRRAKRKDIKDRSDDEIVRQQLEETILKAYRIRNSSAELATMMDKSVNDVISACMTAWGSWFRLTKD